MPPLLRTHLAHLRRKNARPATLRDRRDTLLRFNAWLSRTGTPLDQVTQDHIERYLDQLRVSVSSKVTYLSHLKSFYAWAYEYELLAHDPAARVVRPRLDARQARPVPNDDFRTALRTANGDLVAMLILAGYLGLRVGEIAAITREDVLREPSGRFLIVHGKGGKERTVPLPAALFTVLEPWFAGHGPVFLKPKGAQATGPFVTAQISDHFHMLGMAHTAHKLRHRAATRLLSLTRDLRLVQQILGHASPATTAGYTAIGDAYSLEAVGLLAGELAADLGAEPPEDDGPPARPGLSVVA